MIPRYLVLEMCDGRWIVDTSHDDKASAIDYAHDRTMADNSTRAVAIITRTVTRELVEKEYPHE